MDKRTLYIISGVTLILSQISSMIVPLFYIISKTCRHHPAKIIVFLCILEMISTYQFFMQSICFQVNFIDKFQTVVNLYTFHDPDYNKDQNTMSKQMCWFNQTTYTLCLYAQIGYYIILCIDYIITLKRPFWPGQSRVIWYHLLVFILTSGFSAYAFLSTIKENCESIQECRTNAPDESFLAIQFILLIVATVSIFYGLIDICRKRHQNQLIKKTRSKYFKNHIILMIVLSISWGPVWFQTYIDTINNDKSIFYIPINENFKNYLRQVCIIIIISQPILLSFYRFGDAYFRQSIRFFIRKIRGSLTQQETLDEKERQSMENKLNDNWLIPLREMVQMFTDQQTIENILSCIVEIHKDRINNEYEEINYDDIQDIRKLSKIKNEKKYTDGYLQDERQKSSNRSQNKLNENLIQQIQSEENLEQSQIPMIEPLLESSSHRKKANQSYYSINEYAPKIFENLRQKDKITNSTLVETLDPVQNENQIKQVKESLGKSGSFFFFSKDRKLILKSMKKFELETLISSVLKEYFIYINQNPQSLIARIYGVYTINLEGISSVYLILMENTLEFFPKNDVKLYDLKGSLKNRLTTLGENLKKSFPISKSQVGLSSSILPIENSAQKGVVYKDQNFLMSTDLFMQIGSGQRDQFIKQLQLDTDFLKNCQIMDYSLLIAIYQDTEAYSNESLNSIIRSSLNRNPKNQFRKIQGLDKIYYSLAIIDVLQEYGFMKKVENFSKTFILGRRNISCVNPEEYSSRFISFINMIVAGIVD